MLSEKILIGLFQVLYLALNIIEQANISPEKSKTLS